MTVRERSRPQLTASSRRSKPGAEAPSQWQNQRGPGGDGSFSSTNSVPLRPSAGPVGGNGGSIRLAALAGGPGWQLLERPHVAVGVAEGDERAPRLHVDVAGLNAVREELLPGGLGVGHHALNALLRPGRHRGDPGAEDDGTRRPGRGELDEPQRLAHLVIVVGVEAHLVDVKRLGTVHVGYGYRH